MRVIVTFLHRFIRMIKMSRRNLQTVNTKFRRGELERRRPEFYKKVAEMSGASISKGGC